MRRRAWLAAGVFAGALGAGPAAGVARAEDTAPPVINHQPVTKATRGEPLIISAQFKDESEIFAPTLYYRPAGQPKFLSLPMTRQNDAFIAIIPGGPPVDYWFEAYDEVGNGPSRMGSANKPVHVDAQAKAPPVAHKPKELPGPVIHHDPVTTARVGSLVKVSATFEGPNGVFAPTVYVMDLGQAVVRSLTLIRESDRYSASFTFEGVTNYWIEAFDEQGNGPSHLGSEAQPMRIGIDATVEVVVVEPVKPPPPLAVTTPPVEPEPSLLEGEWLGFPRTWWLAGAAGVLVAGTVVGVAAANAGPPAPVLNGLVAPGR